jgi:predicted RNA-binding Zn ribbon-like protein
MSGPIPAEPSEVALVRSFVNTAELDEGTDALGTPSELVRWLADQGLLEPGRRATRVDLRRAVDLREALRALMLANNGLEADIASASATLDETARQSGLGIRFFGGGVRVDPRAGGVSGALGRILAIVAASMADGTWSRVKACRADDCRWSYFDHARNRSRAWCSMSSCGNREKARAFRRRHAQ